jgi:hypothetical protein
MQGRNWARLENGYTEMPDDADKATAHGLRPARDGAVRAAARSGAEAVFKPVPTQYIAALGDPRATSGTGAHKWGLWRLDPGPRGVRLIGYETLKANGGVAPAQWKFGGSDWWLEEHGLIMEQPEFPLPAGKYVVTGGREMTAVLTANTRGSDGAQHWKLDSGAKLYDVTHLRCRSARYTPAAGGDSCSPLKAQMAAFPVAPGAPMPPVEGCRKQDYEVLIVIGMVEAN